jgi:alpha-tubulin suppressor-like RCC1 family protein
MRLITRNAHAPEHAESRSVTSCRTGHTFDAIELDEHDAYRLRQLSPEQLKEWLDTWSCGYRFLSR